MGNFFIASTFLLGGIITISFFSCQPEVQPYTQQIDSTGGKLSYVTGHGNTNRDTFYVSYLYDAQNRWAGSRIFVIASGDTTKVRIAITRDAAGYVTKITELDSSYYNQTYTDETIVLHSASGRYTRSYRVSTPAQPVLPDTTTFIYDSQGRIITTNRLDNVNLDTTQYHYTGSNLDSLGMYAQNFTSVALVYDNKIAPSNLGNEAFLIDLPYVYGVANVTRYTHFDGTSIDGQGIINYTFNATNLPVRANFIVLPTNEQYTFYYHYQ